MKRFIAALAVLGLAACTPQPKAGSPEAAVTGVYDTLVKSKGQTPTPKTAIPMTAELAALVEKAEASVPSGEPVFDFDLAGNCQDCTDFNSLKVAAPPKEEAAKIQAGHTLVEATFKTGTGATAEAKAVRWYLVGAAGAWSVDNITSEDFDLRAIAETLVSEAAAAATKKAEGDAAVECTTYILLQQAAAPKDAKKLDAAAAAWRAKASTYFTADELAQYLASSQAVLDDTPPKDLADLANVCVAKTPAQ